MHLPAVVVTILLSGSAAATTNANLPQACAPPHDYYQFCNATLPLNQRIDDLISRLKLEEKPYLLTARESPWNNISRLGLPELDLGANCMHGVQSHCTRDGRCPTSFPNPNTLGQTFNRTLWKGMGAVIGLELRALWLQNVSENNPDRLPHIGLDCWSPNLNIVRDPRWGRNLETPSEDPFLIGVYGAQYTLGLQNNADLDARYLQAVSTLKHFDANSLEGPYWTADGKWDPEHGNISRHNVNVKLSLYDWFSTYLPAFEAAVKQGGAASVMCSYNRINGAPACAHEYLLEQVLRKDWNFRGYVTSDSGAIDNIFIDHKYTSDWPETVQVALQAGCDVESSFEAHRPWATGGRYIDEIVGAVQSGLLEESLVDRALRNTLEVRFRLGLFDPIDDQPFWNVPSSVVQQPRHVQTAKEATAQGLVLLKNENNLLPIDIEKYSIALIGPHIDDERTMAGNYIGQLCPDSDEHCVMTFSQGFANVISKYGGRLKKAKGCAISKLDTCGFVEAVNVALESDVVVFIGGLDLTIENEGHDRHDIRLPSVQTHLLKKIVEVNSNIVLVLMHGGMVGLDAIVQDVPAIVSAGYPGRYAGEVLPGVLFGHNERAWGKLAVTWYHDAITEELNMMDFSMTRPPGRTYRYYRGVPQFRFGHGINPLTTFDVKLVTHVNREDDKYISLTAIITNSGNRAGDEVITAFFSPPADLKASNPASFLREQLFSFDRVHLKPGVTEEVFVVLSSEMLRLHDVDGMKVLYAGTYRIRVTNGMTESTVSVRVDQKGMLAIAGEEVASKR